MQRAKRYLGALLFTVALAAPVFSAGCASQGRSYRYNNSYRWNRGEDPYYRQYLRERRMNYRDFRRLNEIERRNYWNWRHNHR